MIVFNCPKCGKEFKAKDQHAGRKFACSKCTHEMYVPTPQELQKSSANSTADSEPASVPLTPMEFAETFSLPPEEPAEVLSAPTDTPVDSEPASATPTPMEFAETYSLPPEEPANEPSTPSMEPVVSSFTSTEEPKESKSKLMARMFGSWARRCSVQLLLASLLLMQLLHWNYAPQWGYEVVTPADDQLSQELNHRGSEGWELVSSRRVITGNENVDKARHEMFFRVDRGKRRHIVVPKVLIKISDVEEAAKDEVRKKLEDRSADPKSIEFSLVHATDEGHDVYEVFGKVAYVVKIEGVAERKADDYFKFRLRYFSDKKYVTTESHMR